jgi:hypothetical protein
MNHLELNAKFKLQALNFPDQCVEARDWRAARLSNPVRSGVIGEVKDSGVSNRGPTVRPKMK